MLKQKAPHNAYQLLQKLKSGEQLKPFQAFYLSRYMPNKKQETHPIYGVTNFHSEITKVLNDLPQDVRDKASEVQELTNPELLNVLGNVIHQIQEEAKGINGKEFVVKPLGTKIRLNSQFMEIRLDETKYKSQLSGIIEKFKGASSIAKVKEEIEKLPLQYHEGVDFSGWYTTDGTLHYIRDEKIKAPFGKVLDITDSTTSTRQTKDITILEYNENTGMVLTTFRHTQLTKLEDVEKWDTSVKVGDILTDKQQLGTYKITHKLNKDPKYWARHEHSHLEKHIVNIADLKEKLKNELKETFEKLISKQVHSLTLRDMNNMGVVELMNPLLQGDERQAIALLTPKTDLANRVLAEVKAKWHKRASNILEVKNIEKTEDIYKQINEPIMRDKFILESIVKILIQLKILLEQVNERESKLDDMIQLSQRTILDLEDLLRAKSIKFVD